MKVSDSNNGNSLPLVEHFYTLQGEGFHTGKPAYFIRLGGCDLACSWCDSKQSWKAGVNQLVDVEVMAQKVAATASKSVVVTGGEPLTYNLDLLCDSLKKRNITTFLETSGAYKLSGKWDWICLSPKKQRPPHESLYEAANELKVIIYSEEDFMWAEENAKKVSPECKLYLQTEWSKFDELINPVVEYCKQNPEWNISIQAHKFMKIP